MALYRRVRPGTAFSLVQSATRRRSAVSAWRNVAADEFFGARTATASATLGAVVSAVSGTVGVTGSASSTIDAVSSSASGTIGVSGSAASTVDAVASAVSGTIGVTGTATATVPPISSAASGQFIPVIDCVGSSTIGPVVCDASGTVSTVDPSLASYFPGETTDAELTSADRGVRLLVDSLTTAELLP